MRTCCLILLLAAYALQAQNKELKRVSVQPTSMTSGQEMFRAYCATCHGVHGTGDGPAASALKKAPADLTQLARQHAGKFPSISVETTLTDVSAASHGSKEMPVWGPLLRSVSHNSPEVDLRIANIVGYLESIQAK